MKRNIGVDILILIGSFISLGTGLAVMITESVSIGLFCIGIGMFGVILVLRPSKIVHFLQKRIGKSRKG